MASRSNRDGRPGKPSGVWGGAYRTPVGGSRAGLTKRRQIAPPPGKSPRATVDPTTGTVPDPEDVMPEKSTPLRYEPPDVSGVTRGAQPRIARRGGRQGEPMFDDAGVPAGAPGGTPGRRRGLAGLVEQQVERARGAAEERAGRRQARGFIPKGTGERRAARKELKRRAKGKGLGGMVRSAIEMAQERRAEQDRRNQPFDPMLGVKESLGSAYVDPNTGMDVEPRRGPGGNESGGPSIRRSRTRRGPFER